jgi:hypothetical protein
MKRNLTITSGAVLLIIAAASIWFSQRSSDVVSGTRNQPVDVRSHSSQPQSSINQSLPDQSRSENQTETHALSPTAIERFMSTYTKTGSVFDAAPDDVTGKRSRWFEPLKTWHRLLEKAAQTGKREDLFALVPVTASFFTRDREAEPLAEPLDDLRHWMQHPGSDIIRELGKVAAENDGKLDASTAALAVQVFSVRGFDNEPDWEDERKPIDSAGVLIARPEILQSLESLPIDQLGFFLRAQTADTFFRRYEQNGDGMPVLRQRYSANREALHSSFNNMASKVAAYQASTQPK